MDGIVDHTGLGELTADRPEFRPSARFLVSRLLVEAGTLPSSATGGDAYNILARASDLPGIAVVDGDEIIGYVDRISLLNRFSQHLMRDFYFRRSITLVLDPEPLIIDAAAPISLLAERISHEKPEALTGGYIITRGGRYAGIGTALEMMRASVEEASLRAMELDAARHAAEQASHAKSLFLANMSHEFRTPLNAIIGFAEVLKIPIYGPLNPQQAEYVEDIHMSGQHLLNLVNEILELSKAEAGKLDLHEEPTPVDDLIEDCVRLTHIRAKQVGLTLVRPQPRSGISLLIDPVKARQILMNLLTNAIKFTPANGRVTLTAETLSCGGVEIAVADTGIGMSADQTERAFEPFVQIDNQFNRQYEGTGLGLPLSRRLIELHGGNLKIESTPGVGTTARVYIPAERVHQRPMLASVA
jgi:two-component system cell cycle sensor histidine kinase PleC